MDFGKYLKEKRIESGLSQRGLGLKSGISNSTISRLEQGNNVPDMATLIALAKPLNVPLTELIEKSGIENDVSLINEIPEELRNIGVEYLGLSKELKEKGITPEQVRKIIQAYEGLKNL